MVAIQDYQGREQAYVKHVFLERYLERLVHKTASRYDHVVYVDGFAGPWQSANESFQDTSFGIALKALRQAKATWKATGREVKMSAYLVEQDTGAYTQLAKIPPRYPTIEIKTYPGDFLTVLPTILSEVPEQAFTFFLVDPKGWRFRLDDLAAMLQRLNSEVIFNFMFDFVNRAVSMSNPALAKGLTELIPHGDWRKKLAEAERLGTTSNDRKAILVDAFGESLAKVGGFQYVAETTVLKPLSDRALYCLCYATPHPKGIEVFRDCQLQALHEQAKARAATKVKHAEIISGQREIFESLHEMAPNDLETMLAAEKAAAESMLLDLTPIAPNSVPYGRLWPRVLAKHIVRRPDVNQVAARLRGDGSLSWSGSAASACRKITIACNAPGRKERSTPPGLELFRARDLVAGVHEDGTAIGRVERDHLVGAALALHDRAQGRARAQCAVMVHLDVGDDDTHIS